MKKSINNLFMTVAVIATLFVSCSKDSSTNTTTPPGGGGGGGGGSTLATNQVSTGGAIYKLDSISTPYWVKDIYGVYGFGAIFTSGDTTMVVNFRMGKYLLPSGTYDVGQSAQSTSGNTLQVTITKQLKVAPFTTIQAYVTTGGKAKITNSGGIFKLECSGVVMNSLTLEANLSKAIPTIPSANAAFTVPTGVTMNQFTVGSTSVTPNQLSYGGRRNSLTYSNLEGSFTTGSLKGIKFFFSEDMPPSGTYDAVGTQAELAPGKVYVEYSVLNPPSKLASKAGGKVIVETTSDKISAYVSNMTLKDAWGGTAPDEVLNGAISR